MKRVAVESKEAERACQTDTLKCDAVVKLESSLESPVRRTGSCSDGPRAD